MLKTFLVIFLSVVFICGYEVSAANCNDCRILTSCPGALYLAVNKKNSQTAEIINKALCSTQTVNNIPMVCCSAFTPSPIEIDNHPNLELLPEDCGNIEGSRIVGGEVAKLYEFPWMVLISHKTRLGKQFSCGGSVINSLYVLTAAHCVKDKKIEGVRLGDYDWTTKVDCEKGSEVCESNYRDKAISEKIIHPDYQGPPVVRNDIALLRLRSPADITVKNIKAICLPVTQTLREKKLNTGLATVAGWGFTENGTASSVLLKVRLPVYSDEQCKIYYNRNSNEDYTKNTLCAGQLGKDSCKGDSGGPLMLEGEYNDDDRFIQYGIVSHGPSLCGSSFPGVYTEVSPFMKWILDTIKP